MFLKPPSTKFKQIPKAFHKHVENKRKMKQILSPTPEFKENKIKALLVHDSPYPLLACIFGFQTCRSLFFAWANCTGKD
jgi:hypothetical protein